MTSFAVLMDISRREVSDAKTSNFIQTVQIIILFSNSNFSFLIVIIGSERRDSANQNPDMEYSGSNAELPLPHHDLPPQSESHAVQQDEYNQ